MAYWFKGILPRFMYMSQHCKKRVSWPEGAALAAVRSTERIANPVGQRRRAAPERPNKR